MAGGFHQALKIAGLFVPAIVLIPVAASSSAPEATSAAFNVTPLRIELDSQAQFSTFQIRNDSGTRLALQARGFAWSQLDSEDRFAPTADVAISPSIVEIEPGEIQHFKLLRRQVQAGPAENVYRLIIDQLPDQQAPTGGVTATRLRVSIPVFVNRNIAAPARLAWTSDGNAIGVSNAGGRSVKLSKLAITTPDGVVHDLGVKGPRYVLSGASATWASPASLPCFPAGSFVTGIVDNGPLREPVPQSCG